MRFENLTFTTFLSPLLNIGTLSLLMHNNQLDKMTRDVVRF